MSEKMESPIQAVLIRGPDTCDRFVVVCPFCRQRHYHGAGAEPASRERTYHRVADCAQGAYEFRWTGEVIEPARAAHAAEARASIAIGPAIPLFGDAY